MKYTKSEIIEIIRGKKHLFESEKQVLLEALCNLGEPDGSIRYQTIERQYRFGLFWIDKALDVFRTIVSDK